MSEGYELHSGCMRKKEHQFQENSAELDTLGHHCLPTLLAAGDC